MLDNQLFLELLFSDEFRLETFLYSLHGSQTQLGPDTFLPLPLLGDDLLLLLQVGFLVLFVDHPVVQVVGQGVVVGQHDLLEQVFQVLVVGLFLKFN